MIRSTEPPLIPVGALEHAPKAPITVCVSLAVCTWFAGAIPLGPDMTLEAWEEACEAQEARKAELIAPLVAAHARDPALEALTYRLVRDGDAREVKARLLRIPDGERLFVIAFS